MVISEQRKENFYHGNGQAYRKECVNLAEEKLLRDQQLETFLNLCKSRTEIESVPADLNNYYSNQKANNYKYAFVQFCPILQLVIFIFNVFESLVQNFGLI